MALLVITQGLVGRGSGLSISIGMGRRTELGYRQQKKADLESRSSSDRGHDYEYETRVTGHGSWVRNAGRQQHSRRAVNGQGDGYQTGGRGVGGRDGWDGERRKAHLWDYDTINDIRIQRYTFFLCLCLCVCLPRPISFTR
ncbi:hypothetical protein C8Q74DRAFT_1300903 [Fomes fomentarius]|nr:hypothetical protein C8Q74DRAFT_1300903 [Fomes fomentarius]